MNEAQLTHQVEQNLKKEQGAFWPELVPMRDLLNRPPDPTRWVWREVLPVDTASVLIAKARVGKSTVAANLCVAVARGLPFLGRDTQKSPVAYVFTDGSDWEIEECFQQVGARPEDEIFVYAGQTPHQAIPWLMEKVKGCGARLIVIDTLQRMLHIKNINDYSEVINRMEPVVSAAREHGCHIMLLHHAKRNDSDDLDAALGSVGIKGMVYSYLSIRRLPESETRILTSDQRGGKNIPGLAIGFDKTGWLEVTGTSEEAEIDRAVPKITEALSLEDDGLTEKNLRRIVPVRGIIASKAIRKMFKENKLNRTGAGKKGDPFHYLVSLDLLADRPLGDPVLQGGVGGGERIRVPILGPSYSYIGGKGDEVGGTDNSESKKSLENKGGILVPEKRDTDGTRRDTNRKRGTAGLESKASKWTQKI